VTLPSDDRLEMRYAVDGGYPDKATLSKLAAYVIYVGSINEVMVSKVTAYAIVIEDTARARPQVFVCT
jgi:hypothetical protein